MEATASDRVAVEFAVFYGRELRSVVALAYALTGSWASAEDLAQEAFLAAVRALPKRQRQVVGLYYVDGYSVAEIAEVLRVGCSAQGRWSVAFGSR